MSLSMPTLRCRGMPQQQLYHLLMSTVRHFYAYAGCQGRSDGDALRYCCWCDGAENGKLFPPFVRIYGDLCC